MKEIDAPDLKRGDLIRIEDGDTSIECKVAGAFHSWSHSTRDGAGESSVKISTAGHFTFEVPLNRGRVKMYLLDRPEPVLVGDVVSIQGHTYTRIAESAVLDAVWFGKTESRCFSWRKLTEGVDVGDIKIVRQGF